MLQQVLGKRAQKGVLGGKTSKQGGFEEFGLEYGGGGYVELDNKRDKEESARYPEIVVRARG